MLITNSPERVQAGGGGGKSSGAFRTPAGGCVACRIECVACRMECVACRMECVACRMECVACRMECVACRMFMITDCALGRNDDDQHEQSNHVETIDAKGMHMQLSRPPASATATDEEASKHMSNNRNIQESTLALWLSPPCLSSTLL